MFILFRIPDTPSHLVRTPEGEVVCVPPPPNDPILYVISSQNTAYVGVTSNAGDRFDGRVQAARELGVVDFSSIGIVFVSTYINGVLTSPVQGSYPRGTVPSPNYGLDIDLEALLIQTYQITGIPVRNKSKTTATNPFMNGQFDELDWALYQPQRNIVDGAAAPPGFGLPLFLGFQTIVPGPTGSNTKVIYGYALDKAKSIDATTVKPFNT
ncbi:hypothetical protein BGLA2_650082 [Burkholderia gladioli]|uniref:hypothetical protein n=1 Tax=Burkholderia gladioli TaxID=28095 RepID=UPI0002E2C3AC|nr:hypothetical protein [Burkholderia gladioli]MBW5280686.1 hypothetical protein [Burkholderia gladioli]NHH78921.1 hypothetical protein [Burkholderia gladioli]CAG9235137.1 hypothetical protein BGLA2_650082 [Burkholderia gladioli]